MAGGFSLGFSYFAMFGMYGLSFWYGTTEVLKGNIEVGDMMTTFFNILIATFGLGTVSYTHYVMQGWILEFWDPRQTQNRAPKHRHCERR